MTDWEWLTINDACRILKVSRRTLYTYMESGRLPFYQAAGTGHRRIRAEDLDRLMMPGASPNGRSITDSPRHLRNHIVTSEQTTLIVELERERLERQQLDQELEQLRPLLIWAGHPCALCRKPLRGVVEPEVAQVLLKDLAHKLCLVEREKRHWFPITLVLERPLREAD